MPPKCKACGAPVSLVPDGDPHYDAGKIRRLNAENVKLRKEMNDLAFGNLEAQHRGAKENTRLRAKVVDLDGWVEGFEELSKTHQEWIDKLRIVATAARNAFGHALLAYEATSACECDADVGMSPCPSCAAKSWKKLLDESLENLEEWKMTC